MKKDDIVKLLSEAAQLEERNGTFASRFLSDDYDWCGVSEEKVKKVQNILKVMCSQALSHKTALFNLSGMIEESERDDL
jgi:hypothetical protein